MNPPIQDSMLVEPFLQAEIARRCQNGDFPDEPQEVSNDLGLIDLPGGESVRVWLCHAADAVILDNYGQTLLITRRHNPGQGKKALPGGFLEMTASGMEFSRNAALRETMEEADISAEILAQADIMQLGHRRHVRPFDIRQAWNDLPGTPIRKNELFTVSTLAFRVKLAGNLRSLALQAGDDATGLTIIPASEIALDELAVPDHLEIIHEALNV
ncbi:MAG: NUDIX domain-containing protein [Rhodospirillales bacterium]|nr:NUDIX domain-containing protein [Rhodospirillales bacterium]